MQLVSGIRENAQRFLQGAAIRIFEVTVIADTLDDIACKLGSLTNLIRYPE